MECMHTCMRACLACADATLATYQFSMHFFHVPHRMLHFRLQRAFDGVITVVTERNKMTTFDS